MLSIHNGMLPAVAEVLAYGPAGRAGRGIGQDLEPRPVHAEVAARLKHFRNDVSRDCRGNHHASLRHFESVAVRDDVNLGILWCYISSGIGTRPTAAICAQL